MHGPDGTPKFPVQWYDLTTEQSFDSQTTLVINGIGLFSNCYPWVFVQTNTARRSGDLWTN